jgi:undecaprenyl pyrophosphate phosphatase UppP
VGITGLVLEHTFRTLFAEPLAAAVFLTVNGLVLFAGEVLRRRAPVDNAEAEHEPVVGEAVLEPQTHRPVRRLATLSWLEAAIIGFFQSFALGVVLAGLASYVSVRWLTRWFETKTLTPFAIYRLVAGAACIVVFA